LPRLTGRKPQFRAAFRKKRRQAYPFSRTAYARPGSRIPFVGALSAENGKRSLPCPDKRVSADPVLAAETAGQAERQFCPFGVFESCAGAGG